MKKTFILFFVAFFYAFTANSTSCGCSLEAGHHTIVSITYTSSGSCSDTNAIDWTSAAGAVSTFIRVKNGKAVFSVKQLDWADPSSCL